MFKSKLWIPETLIRMFSNEEHATLKGQEGRQSLSFISTDSEYALKPFCMSTLAEKN